jgi:ATP-dependent Clp protease ATP-binding subunit ClpB
MSNTQISTELLQSYNAYIEAAAPNFKYFGSDQNVKDLSRALNQYGNNSIMLTGPAGIGRRSLIAGFVKDLKSEKTPFGMMNLDVYRLNVQELFNTQSVPDIEKRFTEILDELAEIKQRRGKKPLFVIDDGTSFAREISDRKLSGLLNKLKAADVASDDFDLILSMDNDALHLMKKSYPNFLSHFAEQKVSEAEDQDIRDMLIHEAERYSQYKLTIEPEAIDKAVELCKRYTALGEFSMPKRVSLFMDEVATEYRLEAHSRPEGMAQDEALLTQYTAQLEASTGEEKEQIERDIAAAEASIAEKQTNWDQARARLKPIMDEIQETEAYSAELSEKIKKAEQKILDAASKQLRIQQDKGEYTDMSAVSFMNSEHFNMRESKDPEIEVNRTQLQTNNEHIAKRSQKINNMAQELMFPITLSADYVDSYAKTKLGMNDVVDIKKTIFTAKDRMNEIVIGQEQMVNPVFSKIKQRLGNKREVSKPVGCVLILGPSGVGKTFLAETFAEELYGSADKLSVINMEGFKEKHTVSRMIGAPPGYAGYDQEPELVKIAKTNPAGVFLLDEIEKAHFDVKQTLLTPLDKGNFKSANGRDTADLRDMLIMMTSNYGQDLFLTLPYDEAVEAVKERIYLDGHFSPEFLNRCTMVFAKFLEPETIQKIVARRISDFAADFCDEETELKINIAPEDVVKLVADKYEKKQGARVIKTLLEENIGEYICDMVLKAELSDENASGTLNISYNDGEFGYEFQAKALEVKTPSNENNAVREPAKKAFDLV